MIAGAAAEAGLREKLRKIEALFAGGATAGARLGNATASEPAQKSDFCSRMTGRVSYSLHCVAGTELARFVEGIAQRVWQLAPIKTSLTVAEHGTS